MNTRNRFLGFTFTDGANVRRVSYQLNFIIYSLGHARHSICLCTTQASLFMNMGHTFVKVQLTTAGEYTQQSQRFINIAYAYIQRTYKELHYCCRLLACWVVWSVWDFFVLLCFVMDIIYSAD